MKRKKEEKERPRLQEVYLKVRDQYLSLSSRGQYSSRGQQHYFKTSRGQATSRVGSVLVEIFGLAHGQNGESSVDSVCIYIDIHLARLWGKEHPWIRILSGEMATVALKKGIIYYIL